jgi:hypothetical protein
MHCKSLILQHPLTKCHITTSREIQKIKMNTGTANQNKYNTKNTLAIQADQTDSKKKKKKQTQQTHAGRGSGEHAGRLAWVSPAVTLQDPPTVSPTAHGETHGKTPSTAKTHPHRNPIHGETPSTAHVKTHPHRNPSHGETHGETHHSEHRNPRRNPIHGENHPQRDPRCGSSHFTNGLCLHEGSGRSLRGSLFFNFFFSSSKQSSALGCMLFWCIFLVFSEVLIRDWML